MLSAAVETVSSLPPQKSVVEQCICLLDAIHSNFSCQEFIATLNDLETKVLSNEYEDFRAFQLELEKIPHIPNNFSKSVNLRTKYRHPEKYSSTPMYDSITFRKDSNLYTVNITNHQQLHSSLYDALKNKNADKSVHRLYIKHGQQLMMEARDNINIILTLFLNAKVSICKNNTISHVMAQVAIVHPLGEYHPLSTTAAAQQTGSHGWMKVKIAKINHINTIIPSKLAGQVFDHHLIVNKHLITSTATNLDEAKSNETRRQFVHTIIGSTTDVFSNVHHDLKIKNELDYPHCRSTKSKRTPIVNKPRERKSSASTSDTIVTTTSDLHQSSSKALRKINSMKKADASGSNKMLQAIDNKASMKFQALTKHMNHEKIQEPALPKHRQTSSEKIFTLPANVMSPYISGKPKAIAPSEISSTACSEVETDSHKVSDRDKTDTSRVLQIDDSTDIVVSKHWTKKLEEFCIEKGGGVMHKDELNIPYENNTSDAAGYFKKVFYTKEQDQVVAQIFVKSTAYQRILEIATLLILKDRPHIGRIKDVIYDSSKKEAIGLTMDRYQMTLESYLKQRKHRKLSAKQRMDIVIQMLKSLQESHHAGIAHRDLSTVNFMINIIDKQNDEDAIHLYLIDFGKAVFMNPEDAQNWWIVPDTGANSFDDEVKPNTKEELVVWCKNLPMVMSKPDHGYIMYRSIQTLPKLHKDRDLLPYLIDPAAEDVYSLGAIIWRIFADMHPWPGVLDSNLKELRDACKTDFHIDRILDRNIPGEKSKEFLKLFLRANPKGRRSVTDILQWIQNKENQERLLEEWTIDRRMKKTNSNRKVKEKVVEKAPTTDSTPVPAQIIEKPKCESLLRKRGRPRKNHTVTETEEIPRVPSLSPQLNASRPPLSRQSSLSSLNSLSPEQVLISTFSKRKHDGEEDPAILKRRDLSDKYSEKNHSILIK